MADREEPQALFINDFQRQTGLIGHHGQCSRLEVEQDANYLI